MNLVHIEFVNQNDEKVTTLWKGNEYSKDPSEVLLLVAQSYQKDVKITQVGIDVLCKKPQNQFLNERIQRIMLKAGYEWIVPKTITLV